MIDDLSPRRKSKIPMIIGGLTGTLLVAGIGAFLYFSLICPCERTPGAYLYGEVATEEVVDWYFVNEVPLCQIQIWAGIRPHSVNLNCMSSPQGELFLSCSVCDTKYWAGQVADGEEGRLRLNGVVYPVTFNRVRDASILNRAWAARVAKLQVHGGPGNPAPPPDSRRNDRWWSFQLVSSI
jgi:hypothetical protein